MAKTGNQPKKTPQELRLFGNEEEDEQADGSDLFHKPNSLFSTEDDTAAVSPPPPPPDDTVQRGTLVEKLASTLQGSRAAPPRQFDSQELLDARRAAAQESRLRGSLKSHRVVAVVSEMGGSGKTTVALLLANMLAVARSSSSIALFEVDPLVSALAARLDLPTFPSLQPLLNASKLMAEQIDWAPYAEQLSSGLQLLLAPNHPAFDETLRGPDYLDLMDTLCKHYEIVILDTPSGFSSPASLTSLQTADQLILCARAATPDLRAAESSLAWIRAHGGMTLAETAILAVNETTPGALSRLSKADSAPNPAFFATCLIPYDERLADSHLTTKRLQLATTAAYQYLAMATTYAFPVVEDEDLSANPGWKNAQADDMTWIK